MNSLLQYLVVRWVMLERQTGEILTISSALVFELQSCRAKENEPELVL